jgi:hypothetical protein
MKKIFLILLGLCLIGQAQAVQIKAIRSLSAGGAVMNGNTFDGALNPLPPSGGGISWTVVLTGSAPTLSYQIQVQMTDGTWVPISPSNGMSTGPGSTVALAGTFTNANGQCFTFPGPFVNMRVAITAYTSGSLTADIIVNF